MRKTTSKGGKLSNDDSDLQSTSKSSNNSPSLRMELELLAVKAKNSDLTKAHAKLAQENFEMRNEIVSLRRELLEFETKYNNLETDFRNLSQNVSKCAPSLVHMVELLLQVSNNKFRSSILGVSTLLSDRGFTPKLNAVTHTVKPHTVNGTVLNLTPTISLTRLASDNNQRSQEEPSSSTTSVDYHNSLPSTSNYDENVMEDHDNDSRHSTSNNSHNCNGNDEFVSRKSQQRSTTSKTLVTNCDDPLQMDLDYEVESEELCDNSQQYQSIRRLSAICEESIGSGSENISTGFGEIRIYLSRLSAEEIQNRKSNNDTCSSTEVNINDTCLNIETTVIDNQERQVSKRLRADIMVFSPQSNSTRLDSDNSVLNKLSSREERRSISLEPSGSAVQSAEVTPSVSASNENKELLASNPMEWLPTPSMSAMGDIDNSNYSKLDILSESRTKLSPVVPSANLPINTRSKRNHCSEQQLLSESPLSSRESSSRRPSSFVTRQRGGSGEIYGSPMVHPKETVLTKKSIPKAAPPLKNDADDPKENDNVPNERTKGSKKSKKTSRNKSPKRSVKRKKTDETNSLQGRIREIQIRLSNYAVETPVPEEESPKRSVRPSRAAKPKTLVDRSCREKLRRMF